MLNRTCFIMGAAALAVVGSPALTTPAAQAQTVDSSFNPALGMAAVHGIHLGPDNMYYVTGEMSAQVGNGYIVRIDRDGQVDPGFDVILDGPVLDVGFSGNKIVIAGSFYRVNGVIPDGVVRDGIARLNPDGSVDLGFELPTEPGHLRTVRKIQVLPSGSVYVESGNFDGSPIRRLHADGSLDTSFDLSAIVHRSSPNDWIVRADGHLLWFGEYSDSDTPPHNYGDPFSEFDAAGNLVRTLEDPDSVNKIVPRQDGGLVALGLFPQSADPHEPLVEIGKFSNHIVRDWTFLPGDLRYANLWDVAGLVDGRVMLIGQYRWVNEDQSAISDRLGRLLSSGAPDPAWDEVIFTNAGLLRALLVEPDGTTLVGGDFTHVNGASRNGIVRIFMDDVAVPDPIFADGFEG